MVEGNLFQSLTPLNLNEFLPIFVHAMSIQQFLLDLLWRYNYALARMMKNRDKKQSYFCD